jgi:hypothetical protein
MCPQTKRCWFNLPIKSTQYGGGEPKGIMMNWDIIQMDGRKGRRQAKKKQRQQRRKKERKNKRKKERKRNR